MANSNDMKADVRAIERRTRLDTALTMRKNRATYRMIAAELGVALSRAHDLVKEAIKEIAVESAEEVLALELEHLDTLELPYVKAAAKGDFASTEMILKIKARRARYLGLDAPAKTELTGKDGGPVLTVNLDDIDSAKKAAEANAKTG